ncbi:NAD-dependent epimerase/dehydratase family protein [Parabacteroides bouchesdurhonensis]|uniref:NAD-dependent epimerase/dehydratase family protein n=1 Tax=Parabacteroides bouchesdurhonensis TaxID=1936995 RepID=UPI000E4FBDE5|nr:NAD(P)-dependent oxidoreductase [Parabacteroides bouchesdurhonensis]RHJ91145.1 NAD(P)-dependent oxidoreductase [Bacteroides sp. AM07-16]
MKSKKTVFLTGATGTMGKAGLEELSKRTDHFNITLLARPSKVNKQKLAAYENKEGIRIVWGDLTNYDDILNGVTGADYVLHVGGMVSPAADYYPKQTRKVNVTAAEYIVRAVKAQPNADRIKVVYIGSVAQTGHRNAPIHWGRTGDPICASIYDHYAVSKAIAERIFVESGIKHWACLRQTGILCPELLYKGSDPITFHVPIDGVLEWATAEDSGRLLANVCEENVPDQFWNRFYNISSGPSFRLTNYEFECKLLKALSCPAPEKIFEPNWFALRNFHGQWYTDSDLLENYLHFRSNQSCDDYFRWMAKQVPWYFHLSKITPAFIIKTMMKIIASKEGLGTLNWIKTNNKNRISAYFGSYEAWKAIPGWDKVNKQRPSESPVLLNHGYDETKPKAELDIEDMKQAAEFRGGKCISTTMNKGDLSTPLEWECQFGHRFKASPNLILLGGHWCPECLPLPWNYDEIAKGNPFFAQVWHASHHKDEHNVYDESIFEGME